MEQHLADALDEVERAQDIIRGLERDRANLRERLSWVSERALFHALAAGGGCRISDAQYSPVLFLGEAGEESWASVCAAAGADPAAGLSLEQFVGRRADPHGDLLRLSPQLYGAAPARLEASVRTSSEEIAAHPGLALQGLTERRREQLQATVRGLFRELVATEESYVEKLRVLVDDFYRPLLDSSFSVEGAVLDSEHVHAIFGNVEDILLISEELLAVLLQKQELLVQNQERPVLDVFLNMGFAFKLYSRYLSGHEKAAIALRDACANNDTFKRWLIDAVSFAEACNANPQLASLRHHTSAASSRSLGTLSTLGSRSLSEASLASFGSADADPEPPEPEYPRLSLSMCQQRLSALLIEPVQRVPRYEMLLKELHKTLAQLGEKTLDLVRQSPPPSLPQPRSPLPFHTAPCPLVVCSGGSDCVTVCLGARSCAWRRSAA